MSLTLAFLLSAAATVPAPATVTIAEYDRARDASGEGLAAKALNLSITPIWLPDGDRFWFQEQTADGWRYVLVDPRQKTRVVAFDHARLAAELGRVTGGPTDASHLALTNGAILDREGRKIRFSSGTSVVTCDVVVSRCDTAATPPPADQNLSFAPDGKRAVFARDHNLWLRVLATGEERQLTRDGAADFAYGQTPDKSILTVLLQTSDFKLSLFGVEWSPDGRRIVVQRVDQRKVAPYPFIQYLPTDGAKRPRVVTIRTPLGQETPTPVTELSIIDIETGSTTKLKTDPEGLASPYFWSPRGDHFLALDTGKMYSHTLGLVRVDAATGAVRTIRKEEGRTWQLPAALQFDEPSVRYLPASNEVIWFSQSDGWGHLYLLDAETGKQKAKLGDGPWSVQNIIRVDEKARRVYFTAVGREPGNDPYWRHLYSVDFDGRNLRLLTPDAADHAFQAAPSPEFAAIMKAMGGAPEAAASFSPTGSYFIDTASTVTSPPVSVLRSLDGKLVMPLAKADITKVVQTGWIMPEPFTAKAADGKTDVYGVIIKPRDFDPSRRYPVIDSIYNGPQLITAPHEFMGGLLDPIQSFAQLGFVVVIMDGRGTPLRSKAFNDYMYDHWPDFALEDHVAAIKALGARHSYLDLDRVGIIGHSFGGFAAMKGMLGFPDFFKAGVASAGPYDMYASYPFGDLFAASPEAVDLTRQAGQLKGKLLLAYGGLDENAYPYHSVKMIQALIDANKDFDLLYMPNGRHSFAHDPYFIRRTWDFFVRNLKGAEPPRNFDLKADSTRPQ